MTDDGSWRHASKKSFNFVNHRLGGNPVVAKAIDPEFCGHTIRKVVKPGLWREVGMKCTIGNSRHWNPRQDTLNFLNLRYNRLKMQGCLLFCLLEFHDVFFINDFIS